MVGTERLELSRVAPLEPKSSASTNFATSPFMQVLNLLYSNFLLDGAYYIYFLFFSKYFFKKNFKKIISN